MKAFVCARCRQQKPLNEKDVLMSCLKGKPICIACANEISKKTGEFLQSIKGKLAGHPFIKKLEGETE